MELTVAGISCPSTVKSLVTKSFPLSVHFQSPEYVLVKAATELCLNKAEAKPSEWKMRIDGI